MCNVVHLQTETDSERLESASESLIDEAIARLHHEQQVHPVVAMAALCDRLVQNLCSIDPEAVAQLVGVYGEATHTPDNTEKFNDLTFRHDDAVKRLMAELNRRVAVAEQKS